MIQASEPSGEGAVIVGVNGNNDNDGNDGGGGGHSVHLVKIWSLEVDLYWGVKSGF